MTIAGHDQHRDVSRTCRQCGRGVFRTSHGVLHRDDKTPICPLGTWGAVRQIARRLSAR